MPMRGFESSVDSRLNFGLGATPIVDSVVVNWPDGRFTVLQNVTANQFLKLDEKDAVPRNFIIPEK